MKIKHILAIILSLSIICSLIILPQTVFAYDTSKNSTFEINLSNDVLSDTNPKLFQNKYENQLGYASTTIDSFPMKITAVPTMGTKIIQAETAGDGVVNLFSTSLTIENTSLPRADVKQEYQTTQLTASGGVGSYTFAITKGRLPIGITLSPDGTIAGTPMAAGVYTITVKVTDTDGNTGEKKLRMWSYAQEIEFSVTNEQYVYDGQPHKATVKPVDSSLGLVEGVDYKVMYGGSDIVPLNAGGYSINVIVYRPEYTPKRITKTLSIYTNQTSEIIASNKTVVHTGGPQEIDTPEVTPSDLAYTITYEGVAGTTYAPTSNPPTNVGIYRVKVASDNRNYAYRTQTVMLYITAPVVNFEVTNAKVEYDGSVKQPTITPSQEGITYQVTYDNIATTDVVETDTSVKDAGNYLINIKITEGSYTVGTISTSTFVVEQKTVNFNVTNTTAYYEQGVAKKATVAPDVNGFADYVVTYTKDNVATENEVTEQGNYKIGITLKNSNYKLGALSADTFTIKVQGSVDFTVQTNEATYDPNTTHTATVTPVGEEYASLVYTVTYTDAGGNSGLTSMKDAGEYTIVVTITDPDYLVGAISNNKFTINPMQIEFTLDKASTMYTSTAQTAQLTPPDGFAEIYTVTYDDTATETVETYADVTDVGVYRISVTVNDNYVATVTPDTFSVIKQFTFNYGNSPYGLIMQEDWDTAKKQEAKTAFEQTNSFGDGYVPTSGNTNVVYAVDAWTGDNLDRDETAIFVKSLAGFKDTGFTALYNDGSAVLADDVTITIKGLKKSNAFGMDGLTDVTELGDVVVGSEAYTQALNERICVGVYDVEYSFTDKNATLVTHTRKLVIAGRIGDANLDGNINSIDANIVAGTIANDDTPSGRVCIYRVCDVNKDGVVDSADADVIYARMKNPIVPYYAWVE